MTKGKVIRKSLVSEGIQGLVIAPDSGGPYVAFTRRRRSILWGLVKYWGPMQFMAMSTNVDVCVNILRGTGLTF